MTERRWYQAGWLNVLVPFLLAVADALLADDLHSVSEMATALPAAVVLLVRRRWPVPVLLLTLPGMMMSYIWLAPMIALYTVAARYRNRWLIGICGLLVALTQFIPWPMDIPFGLDRTTLLSGVYAALTAGAPVALGLLVDTRRELAVRVDELTRGQEREQRLLAATVLSTERARLAREMHDVVSHQVSLISIQAGALQVRADSPEQREAAQAIRRLAVTTLKELRHMVGVLRAAGGDAGELTPQPTLAELPRLLEGAGLDAELDRSALPDGRRFPVPVERAAYRTVQEALTNVRKHAPGAPVEVRLGLGLDGGGPDRLVVLVTNGPPADAAAGPQLPGGGHGLVGLRERAALLGGALTAGPRPDGGFRVRAEFPTGFKP
ncbi:sensor histidine kinase [Phaeacidiphilus oryzae]|uniref:sensor histidine kinase n=1 Tax=Phaeacidiphilus oryzae TaxID=348818 RepID=UPI00055D1E17|nr:histidine kinase [Phaeacidiphilus oryzae]